MKIKEGIFGLIFIIFLVIFVSGYVLAQEVGKITAFKGKVDILRAGKAPVIEAKINLPVYLKDVIRTKTDSKAEITFKDGTVIRIAPRSRVDISEYFTDAETLRATIDLPKGKVAAYVSEESTEKIKKAPKVNRFEIKTPIAVGGVRGTDYIVAHYFNYSTIIVLKGKVYCYNPQFPERVIEVTAKQMTVIKEGAPPSPPRKVTPKEIEKEEKEVIISKERVPKEVQTYLTLPTSPTPSTDLTSSTDLAPSASSTPSISTDSTPSTSPALSTSPSTSTSTSPPTSSKTSTDLTPSTSTNTLSPTCVMPSRGPTSTTGPVSSKGPTPSMGPALSTGPTSPTGPTLSTGPASPKGPTSPTGPTLTTGPASPTGPTPSTGPASPKGPTPPTGSAPTCPTVF